MFRMLLATAAFLMMFATCVHANDPVDEELEDVAISLSEDARYGDSDVGYDHDYLLEYTYDALSKYTSFDYSALGDDDSDAVLSYLDSLSVAVGIYDTLGDNVDDYNDLMDSASSFRDLADAAMGDEDYLSASIYYTTSYAYSDAAKALYEHGLEIASTNEEKYGYIKEEFNIMDCYILSVDTYVTSIGVDTGTDEDFYDFANAAPGVYSDWYSAYHDNIATIAESGEYGDIMDDLTANQAALSAAMADVEYYTDAAATSLSAGEDAFADGDFETAASNYGDARAASVLAQNARDYLYEYGDSMAADWADLNDIIAGYPSIYDSIVAAYQ